MNKEELINIENLTTEQELHILQNELIRIKNKVAISKIVYSHHGCDSYEDLFRDNIPRLQEICDGIQIAINNIIDGK